MTDVFLPSDRDFAMQLRGLVSMPGDEGYVAATSTWAKQPAARPRFVVHCLTARDVQMAIRSARERNLPLSVRGGGHDFAGRALCDGVVIDLSGMRGVMLDTDHRAATIDGGALASDVTDVTDTCGVVPVTGSAGSVGMTGLTLGGGYGPLIGRYGLALDNMLDAQVVLADGRIVFANAERNEDLFWALRGGGGNFGVVTAMRIRLHELDSVHSGMLLYPFAEAKAVIETCAAVLADAPDEFSVQFGIVGTPDGSFAVMVVPTWSGAPEEGASWLASMMELGTLLGGSLEQKSCGALLRTFDGFIPDGFRVFADNCWLPALDSDSIDALLSAMRNAVSPGCAIITHDFKGAATRVAVDATAFGLRSHHFLVEILAMIPENSSLREELRHMDWIRNTRETFSHALPGGYTNMMGRNESDRATMSFGSNAARLVRIKRQYDPDNLFSSAIPLPDLGS